jgi:ribosomal protein S18 acetylase RimI-like enzyme
MKFEFSRIDKADIGLIKPLWESLNKMHANESSYFRDFYNRFTFEKRIKSLEKLDDDKIRIDIASEGKNNIIGYCISTIRGDIGEIDSLFIEEKCRAHGLGKIFVEKSVEWLTAAECERIRVSVAYGHESVFSFYEKFGFYPRLTTLELRDPIHR